MAGQKRTRTKYTSIYYNETTKRYDIKYNYTVYSPTGGKDGKGGNTYKSKWVYNIDTISEARRKLAELQAGGAKEEDKEITLAGAFELWKQTLTAAKNGSPVTIRNTEQHLRMIDPFLSKDTKVKDITDTVYLKLCADLREAKFSEETLRSLNATVRKLINLCHKRRLIKENPLDFVDNMKTGTKEDYKLIPKEDFDRLDEYFATHSFVRLGVDNYPTYRLAINLLYYTGIRLGELLALNPEDFDTETARLSITKAYVSDIQLTKAPKNLKKRKIPMPPHVIALASDTLQKTAPKTRIFTMGHGAISQMIKSACTKAGTSDTYNAHAFRHTYISNLIRAGVALPVIERVSGDTQATILKRYSHAFPTDDDAVLEALANL